MEKEITPDDGVIVVKNLVKTYDKLRVLKGVSLSVKEGRTTVIIGPSGCGKTVLVKHMIVLNRPTSGEVYFQSQRIDELNEKKLAPIRVQYGFLFQGGALFDSLDVFENIIFPIRQHRKIKD